MYLRMECSVVVYRNRSGRKKNSPYGLTVALINSLLRAEKPIFRRQRLAGSEDTHYHIFDAAL